MTHTQVLQATYDKSIKFIAEYPEIVLDRDVKKNIEYLVLRSSDNKAVLSVTVTLLTCKIVNPEQDIRYHYARMSGGFSARSIDTKHITPFMKKVSFPAMQESGWKTNTLAIDMPYDFNYPGVIKPVEVKNAFLELVDQIQTKGVSAKDVLLYMFILLVRQREGMNVELAKPHTLSISAIISLLEDHFTAKYSSTGASRLPVLAVYAAYQCMMNQVLRYSDKTLCPLESHNSPDTQSGRIGDIDVNYPDNTAFEGVEVKHDLKITRGFISDAYEKFKIFRTDRYYILTTADMNNADWNGINEEIYRIAQVHGCQVIVNGVYDTLRYYLRLLTNGADFISCYVDCMKADETIKFQHKTMWNDVVLARRQAK